MTILTPAGRGAVAVVRVWGAGALAAADAAFRPMRGGPLAATPPRRPRFGRLGAGLGDEVVAVVFDDEPPSVEVQCHGGSAAIEMVVQALGESGARVVGAAEYLAGLGLGEPRAAAWADLAKAQTVRTAEILLEQAQGALDREVDAILIDPPHAKARLDALIERGRVGVRLAAGWRVVIAGRPNAGKSRLLNAMAGYERAIVAPTPGTTRDAVTVRTAFDGWPIELVDTAGVREAVDLVERSGVERALRERATADLTLYVLDRSLPLDDETWKTLAGPTLVVVSKSDLPAAWEPAREVGHAARWLEVSAEAGDGLDALGEAIARALVPVPPEPGAGVPFRAEQVDRLGAMRGQEPGAGAAGMTA